MNLQIQTETSLTEFFTEAYMIAVAEAIKLNVRERELAIKSIHELKSDAKKRREQCGHHNKVLLKSPTFERKTKSP